MVEPRPSLTLTAAAVSAQVTTGGMATYVISVSNVGSAVAKGVAVSVSLAPGFLYSATTATEGNSVRVSAVVRDRKGRFVRDLVLRDFEVIDEGVIVPVRHVIKILHAHDLR